MQFLSGQHIRGYQLRNLIGEGGFGLVYSAFQAAVDREVAIKIILPERANQPSFIRNFEREAQLIARLEHLHIVPIYDFWREPDGAYLVMRLLRGGSLHTMLHDQGPMSLGDVARVIEQMAAALSVAHRHDIIHRDLKPANILLDEEGNAYLSDFGIAMDLRRNADDDLQFFGSPAYMAPEQYFHQIISPQSDVYSLGIVAHELLAGDYPFPIDNVDSVYLHMRQPLPSLRAVRDDLPEGLDEVLRRATAKSADKRTDSVADLALAIRILAAEGNDEHIMTAVFGSAEAAVKSGASTRILTEIRKQQDQAPPELETIKFETEDNIPTRALDPRNPYKGLRPFEEADAVDFHGRSGLVEQLLDALAAEGDYSRFVAVVGPSGSGKSSAVRAGLIPALRQGRLPGSEQWLIAQMTPGNDPFVALSEALARIAVRPLTALNREADSLVTALQHSLPGDLRDVCLFIDQFEELFAPSISESTRAAFIAAIIGALQNDAIKLYLIVTLRADFYDRPLQNPDLAAYMRQQTAVVLPMTPDDLQEAITAPAEQAGLAVEPALVVAIVDELRAQPGALPLLQFALTELFERRDGLQLTLSAYKDIGGVSGALALQADSQYAQLSPAQQTLAKQMFLRLVTPGEQSEDTRRRVLQSELESISDTPSEMRHIIESLGRRRLLTIDRDPVSRAPTVEVAHEALFRNWSLLRGWLDESRDWLHRQRLLAQAAQEWLQAERDPSFLAAGSRLSQFESLLDQAIALTEHEKTYIEASIRQRQRSENRRRLAIVALVVFSLVALTLAILAFTSQQRADQQAAIARSRELAVTSLINIENELDNALLLSREALDSADTLAARNSLLTALQREPHLVRFLHGATDALRAVSISPDGQLLAAAGRDMHIRFWDLSTGQPSDLLLSGHEDWINALAFHPNGRILASGASDHSIRLWDIETGQMLQRPVMGHDDEVWTLAFTAGGETLISGAGDGLVRLWDVERGEMIAEMSDHEDIVFDIAMMPDGRHFVSASADQTLRLWDLESRESAVLAELDNWALAVAVHPEGNWIATGDADNNIIVWDNRTGEALRRLSGHSDWLRDLAFSSSGELASASADGSLGLWDVTTGQQTQSYTGHKDAVWALGFLPGSQSLVSAGADARLLIWDRTAALSQLFAQQSDAVASLAFNPDTGILASASGDPSGAGLDNSIYLWDHATGQQLGRLEGHQRPVTSIAFSPDGRQLISASVDETLIRWNVAENTMLGQPLVAHSDAVMQVVYRPDGAQWASAGFDETIHLWNAANTTPEMSLEGHTDAVLALAYSPDSRLLASGGFDQSVRLWDTATGEAIGDGWFEHRDAVTSLVFSPDGDSLLSTSRDGTAILWDIASGEFRRFVGHDNWVMSAAFHPSEAWIVTGSRDNAIILWDIDSGQMIGTPFEGHTNWISALVFDGDTLYSGDHDGSILRWPFSLAAWMEKGRLIANR